MYANFGNAGLVRTTRPLMIHPVLRKVIGVTVLAGCLALLWRLTQPEQVPVPVPANAMRVLFVGNSHTYFNDMPKMVAELAAAAGVERPLHQVTEAPGGAGFVEHLTNGRIQRHLRRGRWDYVVLQDQQQRPSFGFDPERFDRWFYTPAKTLDEMVRASGAQTIFFMTWARQPGDPGNVDGDTYDKMQARIHDAYVTLAREVNARVAPVGLAWQSAHRQRPALPLWMPDGSHAKRAGSYLAACVLFDTIYRRSALGNSYTAGLSAEDARFLQSCADKACGPSR